MGVIGFDPSRDRGGWERDPVVSLRSTDRLMAFKPLAWVREAGGTSAVVVGRGSNPGGAVFNAWDSDGRLRSREAIPSLLGVEMGLRHGELRSVTAYCEAAKRTPNY